MEMLPIALGDVVTLHELDISHNDLSVRPVVPCVVVRVSFLVGLTAWLVCTVWR